jgi:hypothetical protein
LFDISPSSHAGKDLNLLNMNNDNYSYNYH